MPTMMYTERQLIAANENLKEKEYWLGKLSGEWVKSSFPCDYEKSDQLPDAGVSSPETLEFEFTDSLNSRLVEICGGNAYTLHILLVSALVELLSKYSGKTDIIVATPIYKQETEGDFINTLLAVRVPLKNRVNFRDLLLQVREIIQRAVEHQNYPIGILAEQLKLPISANDFPLFDTAVLLENIHDKTYLERTGIPFHLIFSFLWEDNRVIRGKVEYEPLLYKKDTIRAIVRHLFILLERALADVNTGLRFIDILTEKERSQLLTTFNDTGGDYPDDRTLHRMFQEQVRKTPDATAVIQCDHVRRLSYRELNEKANQLAKLLRKKGIGPDKIAAIMMDNSLEMIVGILAVLKAGGAYLPIGTDLPEKRIISMLNDSNAVLVLTKDKLMRKFKFIPFQGFETGRVPKVITPKRPPVMDLDTLQFPDRSLVDYEKYHPFIGQSMVKNSITLQFSRGCIFKCLYCFKIWPDKYALRTGENLFEEVNMYYKMGIRRFGFTDDLPNFNKKEIGKFYRLIIKNKLKIHMHFPNGIRGDILTPDFIDLMMEAGAVTMDLALETASLRLQKLIRKNVNIDRLKQNVRYIVENYPRAILGVQIMHGFPTETEEEARASLEFIKSFRWLPFGYMHVLKIYPNTAMARFAMEHGVSEEDIIRSMDLAYHELPYTLPFSENFTRQCQSEYLGEFFLNRERLINVLPNQMAMLTEDELVQKYNSYLPVDIKTFPALLKYLGIPGDEVKGNFLPGDFGKVEDFNRRVRTYFPVHRSAGQATRLLLLDLSQHFSHESFEMYHVVDPPMGLMYLLTHLNKTFGPRVNGKIAKSQVDFDSYEELKEIIRDFKPDIIGVRTLNYYRNFYHKVISLIRQWGFFGPLIAGGPYATSSYNTMLQDMNIDLAVLEEGEITMAELMKLIMNNGNQLPDEEVLKNFPGIAFVPGKEKSAQKRINRDILLLDHIEEVLSGEPGENPGQISRSNDLAYIIYTSGSTGTPKGVMVQHRSVVNQITGLGKRFQLDASFNYLVLAAFTFDVSVMHMFLPMTTGAKFYLITEEIKKDPLKLWQFIHKHHINLLNIVPAFMKAILENIEKKKIHFKYLFVGGDVFDPGLYEKLVETFEAETIINIYGPTETTINAALYPCTGIGNHQRIPIGKPLMNYKFYVLDYDLNPVPIGARGELCISGAGVARGYLNHPELTVEKFLTVNNRSHIPHRSYIYRTGDQARWLPDGNIEFLGRLDQQVKIRGFRIELGEIEKRLLEMDHVNEAVVLVKEDQSSDKYLCAFVLSHKKLMISDLRECLARELPNYMIPTYIIQVDRYPISPGGKIDTRELLDSKFQVSSEYMPPTNRLEWTLVGIWAAVLGMEKETIGINENFFDLGGHSLKATILISRIHKQLDAKVPLVELFKVPTIKGLAAYIRDTGPDKFVSIEPTDEKENYPLSSAQKRLYTLHQLAPDSTNYNLFTFMALGKDIDKKRLEQVFAKLISRHESLRTSFEMKEEPVQKINKNVEFKVEHDKSSSKSQVEEIMKGFMRPFDLGRAPLLRVGLVEVEGSAPVLLVDMHHIITDSRSQNLLKEEFILLYKGEELSPLRLQYKDYAQWQQARMKTNAFKYQEEYWLDIFQGEIPVLNLPIDYARPAVQGFEGAGTAFRLSTQETKELRELADQQEATLFMLLLAIYYVLLAKICSQEDIVVGTPLAGRGHADLEPIIGMFVNTLALRNSPKKEKKFSDFLGELKKNTLEAFENQDYPLEDLVDKVVTHRDRSRNPLFDVLFTLENIDSPKTIPDEKSQPGESYQFEGKATVFDLLMFAFARGEELEFFIQYSTRLFDKETILKLVEYFKGAVLSILKNPGQKIAEISLTGESTLNHLINEMRRDNYNFIEKKQAPFNDTTQLEADFDY